MFLSTVLQYLMPVQGVSNVSGSVWRLDPTKHCYVLKGQLPYKEVMIFIPYSYSITDLP